MLLLLLYGMKLSEQRTQNDIVPPPNFRPSTSSILTTTVANTVGQDAFRKSTLIRAYASSCEVTSAKIHFRTTTHHGGAACPCVRLRCYEKIPLDGHLAESLQAASIAGLKRQLLTLGLYSPSSKRTTPTSRKNLPFILSDRRGLTFAGASRSRTSAADRARPTTMPASA